MNKKISKIFGLTGTFLVAMAIGFVATFDFSSLNNNQTNDPNNGGNHGGGNNRPLTVQQIFLNSLVSTEKANIDGVIEFNSDDASAKLNLDGGFDLNMNDLIFSKFEGDLNATINGLSFYGNLNYYDQTIFLDYENSKLYLKNESLFSFLEMLPNYGMDFSLPEELTNFDVSSIINEINSMEPEKITGGYYFKLSLTDDIEIYLKSDENYNFTGFKTNRFFYDDTLIYLDFNVEVNENIIINEVDPLLYQDFSPAFNLVNSIYNTFSKENNTLNLNIDIDHLDSDYLSLNGDFSYKKDLSSLSFDGYIKEEAKARNHNFLIGMNNNQLLINYNKLKMKLENQSIQGVLSYIFEIVNDNYLNETLNNLVNLINNPSLGNVLENITTVNNLINKIEISENSVNLSLNLDAFDIDAGEIILGFDFNLDNLENIKISNLDISGYTVNLSLSTKDYQEIIFNNEEYVSIDPALSLIRTLKDFMNEDRLRLELGADIHNAADQSLVSNIYGAFQFDLKDKFAYGSLDVLDSNSYNHNIKIDVGNYNEVLINYNNGLKAKVTDRFFNSLFEMLNEILANPDDHFFELFGDIYNFVINTPLFKAINEKDFGLLFEIGLINDLEVGTSKINLELSGAILGIEDSINLTINYIHNAIYDSDVFNSITINNFEFNGQIYNFELRLRHYNEEFENIRLDPMDNYIDFDDLTVLLRLGINTAVYNHYYFTGSAKLGIGSLDIIELPLDIKIYNDKGNVSIAIEFKNIPLIGGVNKPLFGSNENRLAKFYYQDGYFYIYRSEEYSKYSFPWFDNYRYEIYAKTDSNEFLDNIIYYLCKVILGLEDGVYDSIPSDGNSDTTIKYENILKAFAYNDSEDNPYFRILIDTPSLIGSSILGDLQVDVNVNNESKTLRGLDINTALVGFLSINASLTLNNLGQEFTLDEMNSYIAQHVNDELNKTYKIETKL